MPKNNNTNNSTDAIRKFKKFEEERNHNNLINAFNRLINNDPEIVKKGTKLSVTAVAKEAGLSRGTLYLHKDVLNKVIAYKEGKTGSNFLRNKAIKEAEFAKEESRKYLIEQLQTDKHKLAQENFKLSLDLKEANEMISALRRQIASPKVVPIRT